MLRCFVLSTTLLISASANAQTAVNQPTTKKSSASFHNQIEQITRVSQGRVGVAATELETGESVDLHGDGQFPMQSVYKLPIAMAVLHRVDQGTLTLTQKVHVEPTEYISERQHSPLRNKFPAGTDITVSELLRYAVSESDGSASDVLMRLAGGPVS